jgi:hypothetical protein
MRSPSRWARLWCRSSKGVLDNDMQPPVEGPRHVHSVAGAKLLAVLLVFGCGHRAALGYCVAGKWRRGLTRSVCSWGCNGWWVVLVFGGSLVGVMVVFSMVEGMVLCAVVKVVMW